MIKQNDLIIDFKHAQKLAKKDHFECKLLLKHGLKSSKIIFYNDKNTLEIVNEIDDTKEILIETQYNERYSNKLFFSWYC